MSTRRKLILLLAGWDAGPGQCVVVLDADMLARYILWASQLAQLAPAIVSRRKLICWPMWSLSGCYDAGQCGPCWDAKMLANVAVVVLDADMLAGLARLVSPAADR